MTENLSTNHISAMNSPEKVSQVHMKLYGNKSAVGYKFCKHSANDIENTADDLWADQTENTADDLLADQMSVD